MRFKKTVLFLFITLFISTVGFAQAAKENNNQPASTRAQRKEGRRVFKENRRIKRDEAKKIKQHHKRLQTKEVRKRMKKDKKKSQRIKENKREFFLKRWFSK